MDAYSEKIAVRYSAPVHSRSRDDKTGLGGAQQATISSMKRREMV